MKKKASKARPSISAELEIASSEFDRPDYSPTFRKAPPGEKRRHDLILRRAKRRVGRPMIGGGAERIQVTVERKLLAEADELARRKHVSRSALIAQGLRLALAS